MSIHVWFKLKSSLTRLVTGCMMTKLKVYFTFLASRCKQNVAILWCKTLPVRYLYNKTSVKSLPVDVMHKSSPITTY